MEPLRMGNRTFRSRLILGSGKYRDYDQMVACWEASGTECVTVALRRVDLKREKEQIGYVFPYLFDATQEVAKAFGAACTPDFFLYDAARRLVYRGQGDGSRPSNETPVTGADLRAAVDAVLSGRLPDQDQRPSLGCNIKWRPGNEPAFFTPLR